MLTSAAMRLAHYFDLSCGSCAVMLACDETDAIAARTLRVTGLTLPPSLIFAKNKASGRIL